MTFDLDPLLPHACRYPPGVVGLAPGGGGIPGPMEGLVPGGGGLPGNHTLASGNHPSQAPSPNQPSKHGGDPGREHMTEP